MNVCHRRKEAADKTCKPLFYADEPCPELEAMRQEMSTDASRERAHVHSSTIYYILVTYLLEFWRHELELRQPKTYFSTVTGFQTNNWWDNEVEASMEDVAASTKKTRWQEMAESFFGQVLHLDHSGQEFNSENPKHLKGLAKIFELGDDNLKTIVRNYLTTIDG